MVVSHDQSSKLGEAADAGSTLLATLLNFKNNYSSLFKFPTFSVLMVCLLEVYSLYAYNSGQ